MKDLSLKKELTKEMASVNNLKKWKVKTVPFDPVGIPPANPDLTSYEMDDFCFPDRLLFQPCQSK